MNIDEKLQELAFEYEIGSRIRDQDGFRATVRYIGPVASAKDKSAIWLGVRTSFPPQKSKAMTLYVQVEWDNKSRGKHDGTLFLPYNRQHSMYVRYLPYIPGSCVDDAGVLHRYFECKPGSGQTAGSFVKPGKAAAIPRTRLLQALRARYVAEDAPQIVERKDGDPDGVALPDAFVSTASGKLKSIQFYGEKKIRCAIWEKIHSQ